MSRETEDTRYLVWSFEHDMWWRAGECGYTPFPGEAGRYTRAEAEKIVTQANVVSFNETFIPAHAI